ncbi:MAG: hypothetical protein QOH26_133 [Actinomycetota bacterium]|jgi:hypothetical protein|nr:hypothetical protein [Actinomycetota bacterium]
MGTDDPLHAPPFFVVGSARSGTTLLRLILNSHPEVAVPPESRFITELSPRSGEVNVDDYLSALAGHRRFQSWHTDIESVRSLIGPHEKVPYSTAIQRTYEAFARQHNKTRWGDKTPRYVENIPQLVTLFPDAQIIHLVRDGRNVALSYAETDFGPKTIAKAAQIWKHRVSRGIEDGRPLGPTRYAEIKYEDFVADTEGVVKDICNFLGIDFDERMFDEEERTKGLSDRAQKYNPHVTGSSISKTRSWQEDMPPRHIEVFEAISGDLLSDLGYERKFPSPSAGARLKAKLGSAGLPIGSLKAK